jgi:hypothetical protein
MRKYLQTGSDLMSNNFTFYEVQRVVYGVRDTTDSPDSENPDADIPQTGSDTDA